MAQGVHFWSCANENVTDVKILGGKISAQMLLIQNSSFSFRAMYQK